MCPKTKNSIGSVVIEVLSSRQKKNFTTLYNWKNDSNEIKILLNQKLFYFWTSFGQTFINFQMLYSLFSEKFKLFKAYRDLHYSEFQAIYESKSTW